FVFGLFHRRIVFGPRDVLLRLFLGDLPDKVFIGAFLIQIVFCLSLRIKFDEDGIFFHMSAGGNELGDDHGADLSSLEPGGQDHEGTRRLRRSIQAEYLRETLPFHSYGRLTSSVSPLARPEVREEIGDGNEQQKGGSRQHDSAGFFAKKGGLVHIALDDTPKESGDQHYSWDVGLPMRRLGCIPLISLTAGTAEFCLRKRLDRSAVKLQAK